MIQVVSIQLNYDGYSPSWVNYLVSACVPYVVQFMLTVSAFWRVLVKTKHLSLFHGQPVGAPFIQHSTYPCRLRLGGRNLFVLSTSPSNMSFVTDLVLMQVLGHRLRSDGGYEAY